MKPRRLFTKALILATFLALTLALTGCAGSKVRLYPIEQTDIERVKKGVAYVPRQDGYYLSDFYLKEVLDAQVDEARKRS